MIATTSGVSGEQRVWRLATVGLLIGLAAFCVELFRVEPTFGLSIPIWSIGPLYALLRFGTLASLVSSVTAAALIVTFTSTYFGFYEALLTLISVVCAVLVVWRTGANRFVDGVLISFVLIVPLLVWHHQRLFTLDVNAGLLVLSTTLLSLLGPALLAQWIVLRPALLAKIGPASIGIPKRQPLQLAELVRLLLVPLMVLSVLVTTHFFTTEWVFNRSAQLERGSKVLAEVLEDLARAELAKVDVGESPFKIESRSTLEGLGERGISPEDAIAEQNIYLSRAVQNLNDRVIKDFKRRHPEMLYDISYVLLPDHDGEITTGFALPSDVELQTNIDSVYQRQYRHVTSIEEQGLLLQTVITAASNVDSGLRFSIWGILASVLLLLGTEWLYRRWLVRIGREAGLTFHALSTWSPGQSPLPKLPEPTNVLKEFDQASAALNTLVAQVENHYNNLRAVSDEGQRLLNQQLATMSALQEPVVVLDAGLQIDERRSYKLSDALIRALEPVLASARSLQLAQDGVTGKFVLDPPGECEPKGAERLVQALILARDSKQPQYDVEYHFDSPKGQQDFWVSVGVIGAEADTSSGHELVLLFTDVSMLLDARQTAAKAAHMASLGEVATGAAHQLNQPLNIIRMSALNLGRYLAPGGQNGPKALEKLERIHAQIDRAAEIIDGMKAFARQADAHKTPLAVSNEVASALEQMKRQFAASKVVLEHNGDAKNAVIFANAASINAIVHSLVGNALDAFVEFGVTDPRVTVHESMTAERYLLTIADNGGGIDEEHLQHIFDPFFTTKHTLQRPGMGLALVWRLVEELGGSIECDNVGAGAVFRVALPGLSSGEGGDF